MEFIIIDGKIKCESDSGSVYYLTEHSCNCRGFAFRKTCFHMKEAISQDLFKQLEEKNNLSLSDINISRSQVFIDTRVKALKLFLNKNSIIYTDEQVIKYEPSIKSDTRPEQVISYFKGVVNGNP